ncbi:hypothetical protein [Leptothoe spongobia]|uniref:hypothetical protein n=1 Tax=Leptothoe spongobia TaxID=2651728 RepID=UPI001C20F151|nr:hypothetical protein [Leptothoe spongobia]
MPWLKALGVGIGCFGLWSSLSYQGLAQPQPPHPPIGDPAETPAVNIDQIVLPSPEDVPEEILRTEIIFDARSPLDGSPLSPADYAQLQTELAAPQTTLTLNSEIRYIIFLLQARRAFKPVIPFLP